MEIHIIKHLSKLFLYFLKIQELKEEEKLFLQLNFLLILMILYNKMIYLDFFLLFTFLNYYIHFLSRPLPK